MAEWALPQCDSKVLQLLTKTHQRLNSKFPFIQESRELTPQQNQLLLQLPPDSLHYKMLVSAMAVETYTEHIASIFNQADTLLETLSVCLSCAQKMKNQIANPTNRNQLHIAFENLYNSLINMTESASLFNPNSPYLQLYRSVISNDYDNLAENIYNTLRQQNHQLKERLTLNDQKIMDLQIKLTRILQEHQGCDLGAVGSTVKSYELREDLEKKQQDIQKMNQDFCHQIQKYNVVYETLKRELDEYKSVEDNVNTVDLIEKLQTEIVVLREEKEREQMINDELRRRLQIVSEANYGSGTANSLLARRTSQLSLNRPSVTARDDQYQPYIGDQAYMDDYYAENELIEGGQEYDEGQMPGRYRLSQNRYSEYSANVSVPIRSSYRY